MDSHRFDPPAQTLERVTSCGIALQVSRPTKPAFGGLDLSVLYVTSMGVGTDPVAEPLAGAVFAIELGVRGLPQPRIARVPTSLPLSAGEFLEG